jgi:signal transduction histidine kinase
VLGDKRVGYLLITRYLDDFSALARRRSSSACWRRSRCSRGDPRSLVLSWSFSRPLQDLTNAARRVAAGDLSVKVPGGGSVETTASRDLQRDGRALRENRLLEERLHFAERSTALGRLASAVAHEIRNP